MTAWQWVGAGILGLFLFGVFIVVAMSIYRAPRSEQWAFLRASVVGLIIAVAAMLASGVLP